MDIGELTIASAGAAYRAGKLSPVEVTEALLAAIERQNPQLNAFLLVTAESARVQARAAEQAFRRGEDRGPLQGIPLALKDLYDMAGAPTTAGSPILAGNVAAHDAAVTERVRAGGAVLLGKLHMHEWALGVTSINPHLGACRNPWDLARIPGGSSGGSAAALAAGLCLGSFGSDTGGSIRIPAALCAVVGLKPTHGRVSLRGVIPLSWSLDHAGPMALTVRDVAILLGVVAGYDPGDPLSAAVPVDDYLAGIERGLASVRILAIEQFLPEENTGETAAMTRQALADLAHMGAHVETVSLPGIEELSAYSLTMNLSDAAAYHMGHLSERAGEIGEDVLARLRMGQGKSGTEYALARQKQREWRRRLATLLEGDTLLATPSTAAAALPIAGLAAIEAARLLTVYTAPFNLTGLPAISLPCGFTHEGLPVGLQLVGGPWREKTVLRAAQAYEAGTAWHLRRPPLRA